MAVIDPHYVWALGHIVMLIGSVYIAIQAVLFRGTPKWTYKLSYTGALLSYFIVVLKSLGTPRLDAAWIQRAILDENVQYAVLALYWWISKPMNVTVIPFAIFSLFHTLTFLRTNILPKFVPPPPPAQAGQPRAPPALMENVSRKIQVWVKTNYDPAMRVVAYAELLILVRLLVGALTFQSSFLSPIFLAQFIKLRYTASQFTREAIHSLSARIDAFANPRGGVIASGWASVKRGIAAFGGAGAPGTAAGPGAAPGAGAGRGQAR